MAGAIDALVSATRDRLSSELSRPTALRGTGYLSAGLAGLAGIFPTLGICPFCMIGLPCPVCALGTVPVVGGFATAAVGFLGIDHVRSGGDAGSSVNEADAADHEPESSCGCGIDCGCGD